jgi:adenosine deaminase
LNNSEPRPSDQLRGRRIPDIVIRELPKTDLLFHLDGSLRIETFMELGREAGLDIPATAEETRLKFFNHGDEGRRHHFTGFFDHTVGVLQTAAALTRVAKEAAEDAATCGCWYLEVRFCPLNHLAGNLDQDQAVAAVVAGLIEARDNVGIQSGVIITGLRTIDPSSSLALAELAVRWRDKGVVAFDLAGKERDYPAKDHRKAFYHLMNNNLASTIHAGEGFGPESIHQALHYCGANRIGHGTSLHEDTDLMAWVNDRRIPVELAVSSNVTTGVVSQMGEHPLRRYMSLGLRVSLNTDNTLFADTDQFRELRQVTDAFDLTLTEVENLLLNGFKSAFLPQEDKAVMTGDAIARFLELRDVHGLDDLEIA